MAVVSRIWDVLKARERGGERERQRQRQTDRERERELELENLILQRL